MQLSILGLDFRELIFVHGLIFFLNVLQSVDEWLH